MIHERRAQILELDPADELILRQLAGACRVPRARLLRWALRWYALIGPWADTAEERSAVLDGLAIGPTGPISERGRG